MLNAEEIKDIAVTSLEDMKAIDIKVIDVRPMTELIDYMVIATGTSKRHVQSLVNKVVEDAKVKGIPPLGQEGKETGEWQLVDLTDVVVHVMLEETRSFYDLERLWEQMPDRTAGRQ